MRYKSDLSYAQSGVATINRRRSRFDLSHGVKTSMSVGTLYPLDWQEVLPGDTFKGVGNFVFRSSTPFIKPVMDNLFMDVYYFFVPSRLCFDKFPEVFGENNESAWARQTPVTCPVIGRTSTVVSKSVGDYLGLPLGTLPKGLSIMPFRAFALIYNEWFRNENVVDPVHVQKGDYVDSEALNGNPWSSANYTGMLPKVSKKKDYFTAALPAPQKGDPVQIGLTGNAPVHSIFGDPSVLQNQVLPVQAQNNFSVTELANDGTRLNNLNMPWRRAGSVSSVGNSYLLTGDSGSSTFSSTYVGNDPGSGVGDSAVTSLQAQVSEGSVNFLYADLSQVEATNVNDLRFAFQLQKILERQARGGTRYREYLLAAYGVATLDARVQVPEFLGGGRIPVSIAQVTATAESSVNAQGETDLPLASVAGMSHSQGAKGFNKSFTEHGYLFCVGCLRQLHTYQQGIPRGFMRVKQTDFYDPAFANIGEQPIWQSQLFNSGNAQPTDTLYDNVFGYNEAWADYRYAPSRISGQMRSDAVDSFDVWHFGDDYANAPVLSQDFVEESSVFVDRTLAAGSESVDNFIVDCWFNILSYRVLPVYSTPGLIDHH